VIIMPVFESTTDFDRAAASLDAARRRRAARRGFPDAAALIHGPARPAAVGVTTGAIRRAGPFVPTAEDGSLGPAEAGRQHRYYTPARQPPDMPAPEVIRARAAELRAMREAGAPAAGGPRDRGGRP
jgi:hypothetical protein